MKKLFLFFLAVSMLACQTTTDTKDGVTTVTINAQSETDEYNELFFTFGTGEFLAVYFEVGTNSLKPKLYKINVIEQYAQVYDADKEYDRFTREEYDWEGTNGPDFNQLVERVATLLDVSKEFLKAYDQDTARMFAGVSSGFTNNYGKDGIYQAFDENPNFNAKWISFLSPRQEASLEHAAMTGSDANTVTLVYGGGSFQVGTNQYSTCRSVGIGTRISQGSTEKQVKSLVEIPQSARNAKTFVISGGASYIILNQGLDSRSEVYVDYKPVALKQGIFNVIEDNMDINTKPSFMNRDQVLPIAWAMEETLRQIEMSNKDYRIQIAHKDDTWALAHVYQLASSHYKKSNGRARSFK